VSGHTTHRAYRDHEDFWLVRELLLSTYPNTAVGFNWEIRRWEGWMYHREKPFTIPRLAELVHLWESSTGRVIGAVHPEGTGDAYLQVHPDHRHIEVEMVEWAEAHLSVPDQRGRRLDIFVFDYDTPRRRLLEGRGYHKTADLMVTRRLRLGGRPLQEAEVAPGYKLRATGPDDYQRVADIINAGFGRTSHTAAEVEAFMTRSPSFRHDLDLAAETGDGTFAAYVGLTHDAVNRRGIVEPVCTHPDHLRRGLARALILEGLARLRSLGVTDVYVDTGDAVPANRLYEEVGFAEAYRAFALRRKWN
jgi:GNAT superfamily N-acetyltransferase